MKVWIVRVSTVSSSGLDEENIKTFDDEQSVIRYVGDVAAGGYIFTPVVKGIYRVDLDANPIRMTELIPSLENFRLVLEEV